MATSKKMYNWSFKPISQKEQNASRWPFKVIRDEGKATKMECRSLSALKESFENTPYNINDCAKVYSRYGAIVNVFKTKYSSIISKITHMCITFNDVYFIVDDGIKKFNYSSLLARNMNDIASIVCSLDFTAKGTEEYITLLFNNYKKSKDEVTLKNLQQAIQMYIKERKSMKVLDNTKLIFDIFKLSDLNFSNLKYLLLVPEPTQAIDYKKGILKGISAMNIQGNTTLQKLVNEIPSLEDEVMEFKKTASNNPKQYLRSIRKIYCLQSTSGLDSNIVYKLFTSVNSASFTNGLVYQAELTSKEKEELNKKRDELAAQIGEDVTSKCKEEFLTLFKEIVSRINNISYILNTGLLCYNAAIPAEREIWANQFVLSSVQKGIQAEYDYKTKVKSVDLSSLLNISEFIAFGKEEIHSMGGDIDVANMVSFFEILPSYFKDNRKTIKSMHLSLKSRTECENTLKLVRQLRNQIQELFEIFLGIQYGMFGVYMKRFNTWGADLAVKLMPTIKNVENPLVYSKNVLDVAERYFYAQLGLSLNSEDSNYYDSENGKTVRQPFESFVKKSIDIVNGYPTPPLTHSEVENVDAQMALKIGNINKIYNCLVFMYEQYKVFFNLKSKE